MEHLAKDLTNALEESESCGTINSSLNWRIRRRTQSAGNLHFYNFKSGDNRSDDSSSSYSEVIHNDRGNRVLSFHQSDSDDLSFKVMNRNSIKMRNPLQTVIRGRCSKLVVCHSLESDSFNEHSPARPSFRRKRKLRRNYIEETLNRPYCKCGKRKRSQRLDILDSSQRGACIKPLHRSIVDKIEKFCNQKPSVEDGMETQSIDDNLEVASESSLSWSGGEGHEGDDELTDWAPSVDTPAENSYLTDYDPREIRAGCRRLGDERPGFRILTNANERVAKFLQDPNKSELKLIGAEKEKIRQLATLYSLDLSNEGPISTMLKKTNKTPSMQPTQRHHNSLSAGHKRIRTQRM